MDLLSILLAQSAQPVNPPVGPDGNPITLPPQEIPQTFHSRLPIDDFWQTISSISWMQALVCVAFAAIYLIYGWRVFKVLVVINCAIIGLIVGRLIGPRIGSPLWGGIVGASLMIFLSWPFMKYCVSALGAMAGAILGAAAWRASMLPDPLIWCGALAGLIAGGFMAFSSFKTSIIMFTSLQGAVFLTIGGLALLNDYPDLSNYLAQFVYQRASFLPALVIVPTILGIFFQNRLIKQESHWAMPE